jgi:hypothetical protein
MFLVFVGCLNRRNSPQPISLMAWVQNESPTPTFSFFKERKLVRAVEGVKRC